MPPLEAGSGMRDAGSVGNVEAGSGTREAGSVGNVEAGSGTRDAGSVGARNIVSARKPISSYRDIEAFQRSMELLAPLHELIRALPQSEHWELASQLRRASKSVPANIAEGYGKKRSAKEFRHHLDISLGSTNEVTVHLEIGVAVGYFTAAQIKPLVEGYEIVARQIFRLIESWRDFGAKAGGSRG
ncbi:MAG: four helix bundle protein [Dehalococcoidia bacterium]